VYVACTKLNCQRTGTFHAILFYLPCSDNEGVWNLDLRVVDVLAFAVTTISITAIKAHDVRHTTMPAVAGRLAAEVVSDVPPRSASKILKFTEAT
jgi:hypothetical protein